mgnify:CR=1 FL=1
MSKVETNKSVFEPWKLGNLTLKNRIIKAATFEGLAQGGVPDERLVQFHEKFAAGGAGVVTVAYGAVNDDARTFDHQMCMQDERIMDVLKKITSTIHSMVQLLLFNWLIAACKHATQNYPLNLFLYEFFLHYRSQLIVCCKKKYSKMIKKIILCIKLRWKLQSP